MFSYQSFAKVQLELWNARELAVLSAPANIEEGEISDIGRFWFSHFSSLEILPLVLLPLAPGGSITLIKIPLWREFPRAYSQQRLGADKVTKSILTNRHFDVDLNPIS